MKFFVAGLCNLETTVQIDSFPLEYQSVRYPFFGIGSTPSGVGLNLCAALLALGAKVHFCTFIGQDLAGQTVQMHLETQQAVLFTAQLEQQPQSVILLDKNAQRNIFTDLKDIQERQMPVSVFESALGGVDAALICNINFARPALYLAKTRGIRVYTDLHAIADLANPYDQEFLENANVLFFSAERLADLQHTALEILRRFANIETIVIGAGAQGAWLFERGSEAHFEPAIENKNIKSTIGAGDALFSSFAYFYQRLGHGRMALARAVRFASHKLGFVGGATGFLSARELEQQI